MNRVFSRGSILAKAFVLLGMVPVFGLSQNMAALASNEVNTGYFGNVAIQGYDPVAYFTQRKAVKGSEDHMLEWLGAHWQFETEEHKKLFAAKPQNYAPQYGGFCATGMAIHGGLTRDIDPEAWAIIDGKLYLNYSKDTNTLLTEGVVSVDKADANWVTGEAATH
jgi:hypothetical protein